MMEHKTVSLADQVFDRLENEILSGNYARNEVLTEMKLCADLGVSRTPIREAIRRLEQEHIVETESKGIKVLGITNKDLKDIFTVRLCIESLAAVAAAKNITDEQIKELKEALDLQEYYVMRHDADHIRYMDSRFHELVYRFSGSAVLFDTLYPLHKKVQKFRKTSVENTQRAIESIKEHREILNAIASRDEKAASIAMQHHVENAMNNIVR